MDYESTDRHASRCVVQCYWHGSTRYLTLDGRATTIPQAAARFRDRDEATTAAQAARARPLFKGLRWHSSPAINVLED